MKPPRVDSDGMRAAAATLAASSALLLAGFGLVLGLGPADRTMALAGAAFCHVVGAGGLLLSGSKA